MVHYHKLDHKVGASVRDGVWRNVVHGLPCVGGPLDGERLAQDESTTIRVRHENGIGVYTLNDRVWQWST